MDDFASYGTPEDAPVPDWEGEVKRVAAQYNGKSEGDLLRDIFARAAEGKRNGTLTNEQIDAFYAQIAPMLDGPRRKKLKRLVEQLKGM